jgi:hypothetical protein
MKMCGLVSIGSEKILTCHNHQRRNNNSVNLSSILQSTKLYIDHPKNTFINHTNASVTQSAQTLVDSTNLSFLDLKSGDSGEIQMDQPQSTPTQYSQRHRRLQVAACWKGQSPAPNQACVNEGEKEDVVLARSRHETLAGL